MPFMLWPLILIGALLARHTVQETFIALLVGLVYYRRAGALSAFLSRPIALFFGTLSYSLYLFNVIFLDLINSRLQTFTPPLAPPPVVAIVSGTVIILLTIPIALAAHKLVELPFIRLGRRLTVGRSDQPSSSQARNAPTLEGRAR